MKRSRFAEEQVSYALKLAEQGAPVKDVCRQFGIVEATSYVWRKKYTGLRPSEVRELRQLCEEKGTLKKLVADLTLDKHILSEGVPVTDQLTAKTHSRKKLTYKIVSVD